MKGFAECFERSWRTLVTVAFVLLVFTIPASKGILGKFFTVHATGNNQHGNNNNNSGNSGNYTSNSSPNSNQSASPVNQGDSCSTGRRHSRPHHNHNQNRHSHYRPNGY